MSTRRFLLVALVGLACLTGIVWLLTPAHTPRFKIAAPNTFSIENLLLSSARDRGSFEKAGIHFEYVGGVEMSQAVKRSYEGGDLDAQVYPAHSWQANYYGNKANDAEKPCFTMVMPFVSRFFLAVVSTTPEWKDVKVVVDNGPGFTTLVVAQMFAKHSRPLGSYEPWTVKGFTMPRMDAMFESEKSGKPAATAAADPLFEYIRRTEGVHILADIGSYPIVNSGLMVRCGDLASPKRRELIRRIVKVLSDEMRWIVDKQASDQVLLPWIRAIIDKDQYDKKYGVSIAGRAVTPDPVEPAARMLERARSLFATKPVSKELMENTVKILLPAVPADFSGTYYDFSLMPKD